MADAAETTLQFDRVFSDKGEPGALHYNVTYLVGGLEHHMEVWRDGQRRLKRSTDGSIETYVLKSGDSDEFSMSVLDLKKRMSTQIDRNNLYRIGNFTEWFDLAHGLKHPKAAYLLAAIATPVAAPKTVAHCDWYALSQDGRTTTICWSNEARIPLAMLSGDGRSSWLVTQVERVHAPAGTFEIHDSGFIHNDANQDIDRD